MGSRPMRIILKPYRLKEQDNMCEGKAYWRATTDFPCTKSGKPMFGTGIDKMTALAALCQYLPWDIRKSVQRLTEANMYPMPDQVNFTFLQLNLDGSKPSREEWLHDRQYYNTFGHLPYYD